MLKKLNEQKLFYISITLIIIDQLSKIWIKGFTLLGFTHHGMELNTGENIIGDFLRLTFVENPGMAFGITLGDGKILLSLFSIVAAAALAWYLFKLRMSSIWVQIGVMLLLSGAVGNLIDRVFYGVIYSESPLFYGKVVDFVDVDCPDFTLFGREINRWWIFNVADACVSCGIVLLLFANNKIPTLKQLLGKAESDEDTPTVPEERSAHIVIEEYSEVWAAEFEELNEILSDSLGDHVISIEHIGSTSVPGLAAKPIIDVDIVIESAEKFEQVKTKLEQLGYVYDDAGHAPRRQQAVCRRRAESRHR